MRKIDEFLTRLFGQDYVGIFRNYSLGILFFDALMFCLGVDYIIWIVVYFVCLILIITVYFLWLVYEKITPQKIQTSLSKIKLLMPFDDVGQIQQPGFCLWGIFFLLYSIAFFVLIFLTIF